MEKPRKAPLLVLSAAGFSLLVPLLGYIYLGPLYAALFLVGYVGGFALWLLAPVGTSWRSIRLPYWLTLAAFLLLHKVEENRTAFFEAVSTRITGAPIPQMSVGVAIAEGVRNFV